MTLSCHCTTYHHSIDCGHYKPPIERKKMAEEETHPIKKIEDNLFWTDTGKMGVQIYLGALEESEGNILVAMAVTVAFFRGMIGSGSDTDTEDKNK